MRMLIRDESDALLVPIPQYPLVRLHGSPNLHLISYPWLSLVRWTILCPALLVWTAKGLPLISDI